MQSTNPADFDYAQPAVLSDPYPFYAAMRAAEPVYHDAASGVFFISRFEDVTYAIQHPEIFSSRRNIVPTDDPEIAAIRARGFPDSVSLTANDPPEHRRFRSLTMKVLSPKRFAILEPGIRALADRLVDGFIDEGEADLAQRFSIPLPLTVIADLLAVDHADLKLLKHYSDEYTAIMGAQACPVTRDRSVELAQALTNLQLYLANLIEQRRAAPGDDTVSELLQANNASSDPLDLAELIDLLRIFFIGGNETTALAISSMMYHLLKEPDNYRRVREDPKLIPVAIEETLRLESPTQWVLRNVVEDVDLAGVHIPAGSRVCLLWASANREIQKFGLDADRFSLDRTGAGNHMAFGLGHHFCVGAPLARMELKISLETFIRRFDQVRLADATLEWRPHPVLRGLLSLPIAFTPR